MLNIYYFFLSEKAFALKGKNLFHLGVVSSIQRRPYSEGTERAGEQ